MSSGSRLLKLFTGVPAAAGGTLRMIEAALEDAVGAVDVAGVTGAETSEDPFELRDPDYIRRTLPALRLLSEVYFRAEVSGLERIPRTGPVLLVGNHSGGTVIADTFVFTQAFCDHVGAERPFYQLAHDLVFKVPGTRTLVQRYGTVPASPENMRRALRRDAALLVYPGGDEESFRPSWQSSKVDFAGRKGFVRLALEQRVPLIPVVALGGQETGLFMGRGRRIARTLALDRLARVRVLPPVLGPPWGVTVLDLPSRFPIPAKVRIRVMPPINLHEELGSDGDAGVDEGYRLVTSRMQRTLTRLANQRSAPVIG
ncbi:MAG: lysophospholipid acyltransferase family protein [Solirubrobacteraceae bacterium]|jgi:1-acyl-sn-glycerol-3-phosphate acyltransferase